MSQYIGVYARGCFCLMLILVFNSMTPTREIGVDNFDSKPQYKYTSAELPLTPLGRLHYVGNKKQQANIRRNDHPIRQPLNGAAKQAQSNQNNTDACRRRPFLQKTKTIVIDPGHGGVYEGCASAQRTLIEKNLTLDVAKRLGQRLKSRGYCVIFTRTHDYEHDKHDLIKDLTVRADFTRKYNADIFVSLHFNWSKNKGIRGYELYVPYESKYPIRSYRLASCLHYELSHKIKPIFEGGLLGNHNNIDHGIRAAKFNVLVRSCCPAVILELEYLSHAGAANMLKRDEYKDQLAHAVYCGIQRYFGRGRKKRERA